jgi:septum site-determining protein MinC
LLKDSPSFVEIKGYGNEINIIIDHEGDFADVEAELVGKLEKSDEFFTDREVILDVGDRILSIEECSRLNYILCVTFKLIISKVRCRDNDTRKIIEDFGWKLADRRRKESNKIKIENDEVKRLKLMSESKNDTIFFKGTLRAGQIKPHRGNILILGDVNPGAEVIATGDIVILGKLKGIAHAGAEGNTSAVIIALELQPLQLRIAGCIGRSPDEKPVKVNIPEIAKIEDGKIVIHKLK